MNEWLGELRELSRGDGLAEQAYRALRDAILSHQLKAGTRLSVPEVARRLGVSRSPAREAVARITAEGLAEQEPGRGAVVAEIDTANLIEIYDLREVLEGLACRLAAARITDPDLAHLTDVHRDHRAAIDRGDVEGHMNHDQAFHAAIRDIAGYRRLTQALDHLQGQIRIAMNTTRHSIGGMQQALGEHETILDALRERDPIAAEQAGRQHVARLRADLLAMGTSGASPQPANVGADTS